MQISAKPMSAHTKNDMPGYITTDDGAALFYREWGAGQPMLFLAGWTMNSAMWDYQMLPLSQQGFRCIAYDRRAHGRSSDPGGGFDYDTLADDLASVINTLDLTDVILVGHSFASGEIVRYLTRHGDQRISKVVLLAPAAIPCPLRTEDNPSGFDAEAIEGLLQALADDFPTWAEENSGPFFTPATSRAVVNWTLQICNQATQQARLAIIRLQASTDFRSELRELRVAVLILHGEKDFSAPLEFTGRPAAAMIPSARLVVYEDGPHGLYFTHKSRVNGDILEFARAGREAV